MNKGILALCLLAIIAFVSASPLRLLEGSVCTYTNGDKTFSLEKLAGKKFDLRDPSEPDHYKYILTMCQATTEPACLEKHEESSLCQYDMYNKDAFTSGLLSFTKAPAPIVEPINKDNLDAGIKFTFENGQICPAGFNQPRRVSIKFTCSDKEVLTLTEDPNNLCFYEAEVASKSICQGGSGDDDGLSGGSIFLIILMSALVLYLIVGFIIMFKVYGKRGLEAIPHKNFWVGLPGLCVDGCKYVVGKIKGCFGSSTITTSAGEYEAA